SLSQNGNLPENYNGLGYRQLLYIYLKVKSYTQKFEKRKSEGEAFFHILLIEEPEANLHAPVQRVLIKEIENMVSGTNR
ncbi:AAA family ATPase, partial [Bacillus sp. SIMBA_161]